MPNFETFSQIFSSKNYIKTVNKILLTLKINSTVLLFTIFAFFDKIDEILGKNSWKAEQKLV